MRTLKILILVGIVLAAATSAEAASKDPRERAAKKACLNGSVAKGVDLLTDLYLATNDPTYIFNQGRCFEQNNRYEDALGRFREYLRKAGDASGVDKADAQKHITELQGLVGKKDAEGALAPLPPASEATKRATIPPPEPPVEPAVPRSLRTPVATGVVAEQPAPPAPIAGGAGLRLGGVVVASVGAAALVGGLVLNLKYNSTIGEIQGGWNDGKYSSNQTYKTASQIGYGVGSACLVGGAVLYYLGWNAGQATVAPAALAGGGGATLVGAF